MKKVEIITRPDKLEGLKELLTAHNCQGMTVSTVMGCGKQRGYVAEMNLPDLTINLLPKIFVILGVLNKRTPPETFTINVGKRSLSATFGRLLIKHIAIYSISFPISFNSRTLYFREELKTT